jgi:hypothetical protein
MTIRPGSFFLQEGSWKDALSDEKSIRAIWAAD